MRNDGLAAARFLLVVWFSLSVAVGARRGTAGAVEVRESIDSYTLSNGSLSATVEKRSGQLTSLRYNEIDVLDATSRHAAGYWSHAATSDHMTQRVTIDPASNGGARGEISIKGLSDGRPMGRGPGGSTVCDIEIRYCLARDDSALYTYCVFDHPANYPATSVGEARFCAKLNDSVFDWMTVNADRNLKMPTAYDWDHGIVMNMKEARLLTTGILKGRVEHKYDYSANQFDVRTWGWSGIDKHVGVWFINPSVEYLSGGPTKIELSAHRDATFNPDDKTAPAPPCLLNYWRGSHYGGSSVAIAAGEKWTKVVGPFAIYCNAGPSPEAMWQDALGRETKETGAWPYEWVEGVDYPHRAERGMVAGRLVLDDPQTSERRLVNLRVGLSHSNYSVAGPRGGTESIDWQKDAKYYQFWTRGDADGRFSIPDIRQGRYTLHAICDSVLGEFALDEVVVEPGKTLDLGTLKWKPVRFGKQIWEIGVPDRTAREFFNGDHARQWGMYNRYPKDFPNDVRYVVGRSDYHKDWNFIQVPRAHDDTGKGHGDATPWTVEFNLPQAPVGRATLRLAFAGTEARNLDITVNDQPAGSLTGLPNTSAIHRDSDRSYWAQYPIHFDASLLKAGRNDLRLTVPAGSVTAGVMYDYLRLELDESKPTLFLVGDSTVRNGSGTGGNGQWGWGDRIGRYFDPEKINFVNRARGGRSSRTFLTEGLWAAVLNDARPGDFVLIQLGHNDGGPLAGDNRERGSLRGIGEETQEVTLTLKPRAGQKELVHTYGWYLRKYIRDARTKGLIPIICSPIPHRPKVPVSEKPEEKKSYVLWSEQVAQEEKAPFVDLNHLILARYVGMAPEEMKAKYFTSADDTHTSAAGADLNADCVVKGIRLLTDCHLKDYLRQTPAATQRSDVRFPTVARAWAPQRGVPRWGPLPARGRRKKKTQHGSCVEKTTSVRAGISSSSGEGNAAANGGGFFHAGPVAGQGASLAHGLETRATRERAAAPTPPRVGDSAQR